MSTWTYEYKRSRSFIDHVPRSLRSTFSNFFFLETAWPIEAKFHGMREQNIYQMVQVTWPRWPPCPYMVKHEKFFFSGTKRPMTLKVCMQNQVLKYYQVCSNDDPGLTLTYFTTRLNLVPYTVVWEKVKTMDFSETIVVYDIKVGICSQLNEYLKLYEYQRSRLTLVQISQIQYF